MSQQVEGRRRRASRRQDLKCYPLTGLTWTSDACEASLNKVFEHVRNDAIAAVEWYALARKPKRRLATTARLIAAILLGVAVLLPMTEGVLLNEVQPIWISLAIAAGLGAIGLDRALGSTSGWIRCIKTEQQLRDVIEKFELEWECARAEWRGACPDAAQTTTMLQTAKKFAEEINVIVQEETNAWVEEFQSTINQIEDKLRSRREANARTDAAGNAGDRQKVTAARPVNMPAALVPAGYQANEWKDTEEEGLV